MLVVVELVEPFVVDSFSLLLVQGNITALEAKTPPTVAAAPMMIVQISATIQKILFFLRHNGSRLRALLSSPYDIYGVKRGSPRNGSRRVKFLRDVGGYIESGV